MADLDRVVGGLRCRDVLELLPDYLDDDLSPELLERVQAHLSGCDTCEKFGGEYGALVGFLRDGLAQAPLDAAVRARLRRRMTRVWTEDEV